MRGLEGKTSIVTGAGGAIGRSIARRLAAEGAIVGVFDKSADTARETVGLVTAAGGRALAVTCDITDYDAVARSVAEFEAKAGKTSILVNNAGWDRMIYFLETEPSFWDQLIAINLRGPLNMHHIVVRGMAERKHGRVVNIASDAGRVGSSGEAVYAACKGGIIAFTKSLARELANDNVTLNVVAPGPTDTPLLRSFLSEGEKGQKVFEGLKRSIPMKRLGMPDDMAGVVAFLASDDAGYMTGQVVSVSGGLTMHG
jgi:2-hydroxycyclohexanecarboxyl-CoA dehydrogenase